ncbi:MAG: cation:proton antiporter [Bacteroidales bacterium]|nr:cation:proton antiporter [Bacteroidales bacterium]
MTNYIIIALCIIIILSYFFDITSKYSKIPGVLLLILLGITIRIIVNKTGFFVPNMEPVLPVIGTLGLILIVMEASLDLKLNKEKKVIIFKSILSAVVLFIVFVAVGAYILTSFYEIPIKTSLLNSIPLAIISSAVAIPAAINLKKEDKEFVIYESSFSDILGILLFDFIIIDHLSISNGVLNLFFDGFLTLIISIITTVALAFLLHKTTHHVNYVVIMTSIILIYVLAKLIHLPAMLLILIFGLALSNHKFLNIPYIRDFIDFEKFKTDIKSFKSIAGELTFLVRSFFFILFGYYTKINELFSLQNLLLSLIIVGFVLLIRWLFFKRVIKKDISPLFFYAPRGLITILLFLSIPEIHRIGLVNEGVVTQVIFISILVLTPGNIFNKNDIIDIDLENTDEDKGTIEL